MPKYRIRLIEEILHQDSAEFFVKATTPGAAARKILNAHAGANLKNSKIVSLPDGQKQYIDPENAVDSRVYCMLLDKNGAEIREIEPDHHKTQNPRPANNAPEKLP